MKRPRTGMFKNPDGKWSAVSARIRTLYDSVLKETVPQNLRESTRYDPSCGTEKLPVEMENIPAQSPSVVTETAVSDVLNPTINIEQEEASPSLPDQNNAEIDGSKN